MGAMTWRKSGVYVLLVLPVLGLAGIAVAAKHQDASQQTSDPVADAARKAREQKKGRSETEKSFHERRRRSRSTVGGSSDSSVFNRW